MNEANASRTSLLALLSLFAGLFAAVMVLGALCGVWITERSEVFFHPTLEDYRVGFWAARIVAVCAALPALLALILWGAAGAAVRESAGKLRGMALYRMGFVLALASASGAYFIQAKAAEEWNRARVRARPDSAFLWEEREGLVSQLRTMVRRRSEGDSKGFASQFVAEWAACAERWAESRRVSRDAVEECVKFGTESVTTVESWRGSRLDLKHFRKDDVVVAASIWSMKTAEWNQIVKAFPTGGEVGATYLYYVFRRVGNDWKVVGPVPE